MDRQEIAKILTDRRQQLKYSYVDMTVHTAINPQSLQYMFVGSRNYFMTTLLLLLEPLKLQLCVVQGQQKVAITSTKELSEWAQSVYDASGMTRANFATAIGLHRNSLQSNLSGESQMRIDTFLQCAQTGNWEPQFIPMT